MSWARCLHPGRPDDCRCEGCPLLWETGEAKAFRSCLVDGGQRLGAEPLDAAGAAAGNASDVRAV